MEVAHLGDHSTQIHRLSAERCYSNRDLPTFSNFKRSLTRPFKASGSSRPQTPIARRTDGDTLI